MKKPVLAALALLASTAAISAPQSEKLDRGLIAFKTSSGVMVSWRSLTDDDPTMTFDVYRNGVKVNSSPVTDGTNILDPRGKADDKYVITASVGGSVTESSPEAPAWPTPYLRLKLDRPEGGKSPDGISYTYSPNDCSVGDVDGDGKYEIFVKWDPSNSHDNSEGGYTGNVLIDCYTLEGKKLWRIDLGQNIRAGAHYTQFMVYDFDGDGKAEMACKTAPGSIDGTGQHILLGSDKADADYRSSKSGNLKGQVITGPEYLTMFDGLTGRQLSTVHYEPARTVRSASEWGDSYGGRSERYLAAVAYLDGEHPSLVMCRGYYTASYLCAWDFDGKTLKRRWLHASEDPGKGAYGEGAHSLTVGDVDGDGCDEIVYGSACIDHDGSLLYRTGFKHGDALHLGDFDPAREGYEVFMVHEDKSKAYDCELRDARTGKVIWGVKNSRNDIGRGIVADVSKRYRGHEVWPGSHFLSDGTRKDVSFDIKGNIIAEQRASTCFRIYWDGDLFDELFDGCYNKETKTYSPEITKLSDALAKSRSWSFAPYLAAACNTTKATPCLQADIFGDWREELVLWDSANSSDLLIFSSDIASRYRIPCLMQDHNYRMAIAWQNVGYNQPPHLGYNLVDTYSDDARIDFDTAGNDRSVELGQAIDDITGSWTNATSVEAEMMPAGLTLTVDNDTKTFTISGTPVKTGRMMYSLVTQGGTTRTSASGIITVTEPVELTELARWSFDEMGATTANAVSGAATVHGAPALCEGISAQAAQFDGTDDYLTQDTYPQMQLGTADFSIEMWLASTDDAAYIFHKGSMAESADAGTSGKWVGLELKGGMLKFAIDDNAVKSEAKTDAAAIFDGEWHHIVAVRESMSKSLILYIDGEAAAKAPDGTGSISDNNEPIAIANVNGDFNNHYNGRLDELTVWSGAMPASKVKERFVARGTDGIDTPSATDNAAPARLTLIDALTGITVATGIGHTDNVTASAPAGIYILIQDFGTSRTISKIIK